MINKVQRICETMYKNQILYKTIHRIDIKKESKNLRECLAIIKK